MIPKRIIWISLSKEQIQVLKRTLKNKGAVSRACIEADIHYNTLQKALYGNEIKIEQRDALVRFCQEFKLEKAA